MHSLLNTKSQSERSSLVMQALCGTSLLTACRAVRACLSAVQGARLDLKLDLHARLRAATPAALLALDAAALQVLFKRLPNLLLWPLSATSNSTFQCSTPSGASCV